MEPVTIASLELENVKRVQLVRLQLAPTGLTVIGGDNAQGKTSIIDGIVYALGGEKYRPTNLQRDGGLAPAAIVLTLSNGMVVERKGKNAALRVSDPTGQKGGQRLLDAFVEELALNLPKFLAMSGKDKAAVLLRILGIGDQLEKLDREESKLYSEREAFGRIADQKEKFYRELPWHADVPEEPITAAELVQEAQSVMARNAERQAARQNVASLQGKADRARAAVDLRQNTLNNLRAQISAAEQSLAEATAEWQRVSAELELASAFPVDPDESTAQVEQRMAEVEDINRRVRANLDKAAAKSAAEDCARQYQTMTAAIEGVRTLRTALLDGAAMPLPGLSVEAGALTYNGKAWDCMSSREQMTAGVAIVQKLKPSCGFVLLDGLERYDVRELQAFCEWLQERGLQAIGTRVSRGPECSVIIEDGLVAKPANENDEQ